MSAEVVVVDSGELGELLATLFVQYGIEAACARTGEDALDVVLAEKPGVVVVESELPDADGLDVAELLRDELGVKVIVTYPHKHLTEGATDGFAERLSLADAAFSRPFRSRSLIESAARLLGYQVDPELSGEFMIVRSTPREEPLLEDDVVPDVEKDRTSDIEREAVTLPIDEATREIVRKKPEALSELLAEKRAAPTEPAARGAQRGERDGRLTPRVLCELLDAFHQTQTTGELWLERGAAKRLVLFVRGVIVGCRTNIVSDRVEELARKRGLLSTPQVEAIRAAIAADRDRTVREVALEEGYLTDDALKRLLAEQTRRIVLASFTWRDGVWRETVLGHGKREPHPVELQVGDAILRGVQLTESMNALREAAPDDARFAPNPDAPYSLHELALTAPEAHVVIAMDGTKTIEDLGTLHPDLDERKLRGLSAGLLRLDLLRFAGHGPAEPRRISFF